MQSMEKDALLIFMKYPVKGSVKTRLAKEIGEEEALRIYKALVEETLGAGRGGESWDLLIYLDHECYIGRTADWLQIPRENIFVQTGSGLGEKLAGAFARQSRNYARLVVIGTDIPGLTAELIKNAFDLLEQNDMVIGPAFDGGYYLLGTRKFRPEIFSGIDWSTEVVLRQTLEAAQRLNLSYTLIETKRDIDTLEDLKLANFSGYTGL